MQAVLVMFRSDGERRSFSITRDMTVIGRREDCDLRIPLGDVSRKHCRLVRDGDALRLEDLGSSNGTYHNGHRVDKEAVLHPGDSIQVGPVIFVLQVDGVPADEDLHPVSAEAGVPTHYPEEGVGGASPTIEEALPLAEPMSELEPLPDAEALEPLETLPEAEPLHDAGHDAGHGAGHGDELEGLEALEALESPGGGLGGNGGHGPSHEQGHEDLAGFDIQEEHPAPPHGTHGDDLHIDFDAEHPPH